MIFENKIRNTPFISCENGTETLEKRITISRSMADDYNAIIAVINTETDVKLTNRSLFELIFSDFVRLIKQMSEADAVKFISEKAEAIKK